MNNVTQDARSVKQSTLKKSSNDDTPLSPYIDRDGKRWYIVPGTERNQNPLIAAVGHYNPLPVELASIRSRGGTRWGDNELAFNDQVMRQAEIDGFHRLRIQIHFKTKNITVNYSTTFAELRTHGQRVLGVSGWEWSMHKRFWSIDGAPPVGPEPTPEPVAEQIALFDFAEQRPSWKGGAY